MRNSIQFKLFAAVFPEIMSRLANFDNDLLSCIFKIEKIDRFIYDLNHNFASFNQIINHKS